MEPRGLGDRLGGFVAVVVVLVSALVVNVSGNLVFPVSHKFNGREGASLSELKAHDRHRHARFLGATQNAVDMALGGSTGQTGLYFTKLGIGNPSHDYYLQVDTGSNLFWVSCAECGKGCPDRSELIGVKLTPYDRNSSSTSKVVSCGDDFCTYPSVKDISDCKPDEKCNYHLQYVGKDKTSGYFVKDDVQFQKASGNFQTSSTSGSVIFGCGTQQSGVMNDPEAAISGLIGFDQGNITMLSQLAAAGKVRNKFAHCLDSTKQGGGIWAIGEVVEPKMMHTSPTVPNQTRYNIVVEKIEVGSDAIELPTSGGGDLDETSGSSPDQIIAFFDTGTTLAHLPPKLHEPIVKKILATVPGLKFQKNDDGEYSCFEYSKNVDEKFPIVKFTFKNSASLWVYPHDYLFNVKEGVWCHGWMKLTGEDGDLDIILGDMTLSNKLVVYDLENQVLRWADHNCSSSIKVKDDESGSDYSVQYHHLAFSDASSPRLLMSFVLLVTAAAALQMISI